MYWSRVPAESRHGIILGYTLSFVDATDNTATWTNHTIQNDNTSSFFNKTLAGLKIYTPYTFRLLAFTYRAEGPFSDNLTVWTDDFSK